MNERRKFLRFGTRLNALCELMNDKRKTESKVVNISKEGALILLNTKAPLGAEIKLSMDVPGDNVPIFASCQVAWQEMNDKVKDRPYHTGVRFTKIDGQDKGRLLEYVYTQWLKIVTNDKK